MYELIQAEKKHLDQICELLSTTGYGDLGLKNNSTHLCAREFMREYIAKVYLPFTIIAVEKINNNSVLGVIVCVEKEELAKLPDYSVYLDPRIIDLFKNLFTFEITESYHIAFFAVCKESRGQGIGETLFNYAEKKAKEKNLDTISLFTVSCQTSSIAFYFKMGMMMTNVISVEKSIPFPHILYLEKNEKLKALQNYFDTPAYQYFTLFDE